MHKLPHPDYDTWLEADQLETQIPVNPARQARLKRLVQYWQTRADGFLENLLLYRQELANMEQKYTDSLEYLEMALRELKKQPPAGLAVTPGIAGTGESAREAAEPS